jgi:protein-tyrosine-phosphatase
MKKRVLFRCVHNSARSQMAEVRAAAADRYDIENAGLEAGSVRLEALAVMRPCSNPRVREGAGRR